MDGTFAEAFEKEAKAKALISSRIQWRQDLRRAMADSDQWAIEMTYTDAAGNRTRRVVSPIRWESGCKFLALCLCRERPQSFNFLKCEDIRLVPAANYVMPVPIVNLESVGNHAHGF